MRPLAFLATIKEIARIPNSRHFFRSHQIFLSFEMDFDSLPDNFFLRVLQHLPFKQQCQVGVISQNFRRMSEVAISQTTSLSLEHSIFKKLPTDSLAKIFALCRGHLEEISMPGKFFEIFAEFSFPRLKTVELTLEHGVWLDFVDVIMANNPALKSLWLFPFSENNTHFASTGVASTNLEELIVDGYKYF